MLHTLKEKQRVKVWPLPGLRVKVGPDQVREVGGKPTLVEQRVLASGGEEVTWSLWWHDLAKAGAVVFSDPSVMTHATHHKHPHEWVADFGKPAMHLDDDELAATKSEIAWHLVPGSKDARDAHLEKEAAAKSKAEAVEAPRAAALRGETSVTETISLTDGPYDVSDLPKSPSK